MSRRVSIRSSEAAPVGYGPGRSSGDAPGGGRRSRRWGWLLAAVGSAVTHGVLLSTLAVLGDRPALHPDSIVVDVLIPHPEPAAEGAVADPRAQALPDPPLPAEDEVPPHRRLEGEAGDLDVLAVVTQAPRQGTGREKAVAAPDQGQTGGARADNPYRRDRSTLHSRLSDGATVSQLSRLRTAPTSSSPQAVRLERVTGVGDSVATAVPSRLPSATEPDSRPAPAGDQPGAPSGARVAPRVDPHPEIERVSERATRDRSVGPLDAEAGSRSFDTEVRGPAMDRQTARAASNDRHPGITDFSRPGVAGPRDSVDGRGPGRAPGATTLMTTGTAPNDYGARNPDESHTEVIVETVEREYDRYRQEMERRVQLVLVFPHALALRLEQGETVVTFAVRPDGRVGEGPRIVKSSGFPEFDAEAIKAVLRAAPFPRRNDVWRGNMRVTFENPLIR